MTWTSEDLRHEYQRGRRDATIRMWKWIIAVLLILAWIRKDVAFTFIEWLAGN